jgi:hypothetical protein
MFYIMSSSLPDRDGEDNIMLFRTVYGSELEAIYNFIAVTESPLFRQDIHAAFIPQAATLLPTQSVDDALAFLESVYLIKEQKGYYLPINPNNEETFRVKTLRQLRNLELGNLEPIQPIDSLYLLILTELFIQPNRLFVVDVHGEANRLRQVSAIGGLSREKVQAWKRVMEFLGVGQRVANGFRCAYSPQLLLEIITEWSETSNTLQLFFEEHFNNILSCHTVKGTLAQAVEVPLYYLNSLRLIALSSRQDSPSKPYFDEQKWRYITRLEVAGAII